MAVAVADPRFLPFFESATAQTATAVLVTAILAPVVASWVLKRAGGLTVHDPVAASASVRRLRRTQVRQRLSA
ncbi:2-keto-3-deoxygluconate permease [Agrobacterium sp. P15N1-A]|uniref:2-keto-3-deoxygluconate permease n=1 Tax=Agrobacterium sp. P15N1-A TaxID=3342820 RepID=UPI0037CE7AC2